MDGWAVTSFDHYFLGHKGNLTRAVNALPIFIQQQRARGGGTANLIARSHPRSHHKKEKQINFLEKTSQNMALQKMLPSIFEQKMKDSNAVVASVSQMVLLAASRQIPPTEHPSMFSLSQPSRSSVDPTVKSAKPGVPHPLRCYRDTCDSVR